MENEEKVFPKSDTLLGRDRVSSQQSPTKLSQIESENFVRRDEIRSCHNSKGFSCFVANCSCNRLNLHACIFRVLLDCTFGDPRFSGFNQILIAFPIFFDHFHSNCGFPNHFSFDKFSIFLDFIILSLFNWPKLLRSTFKVKTPRDFPSKYRKFSDGFLSLWPRKFSTHFPIRISLRSRENSTLD
jgi:hypothetical protein